MDETRERVIGVEAKQRDLDRRIGRLEVGEDAIHARITKVELRVAYFAGAAAAVGGLIGTLVGAGILKFGG